MHCFHSGSSLVQRDRNSFGSPVAAAAHAVQLPGHQRRIACNGSQLGLYFQIPSNRLASVQARIAGGIPDETRDFLELAVLGDGR